MKKVVNKRYAKGKKDYENVINTIDKKGKCPFCKNNLIYHKNPILKKYKGWLLTKNSWPYKNTNHHLIIISDKHKEEFSQLTLNDFRAVRILVNWAIKKFNIEGGGIALRFGNTDYTGATVCHLHFHLITPKINKQKLPKTVTFPIG